MPKPDHPEVTRARRGDLFDPACPTRLLLDRVGSKWTTMLVLLLSKATGELRFTELKRGMTGVSQKMLAQTLRSLEQDGLLDRRVEATSPPRVYYKLTERGESLAVPLRALREWAEANMADIQEHSRAVADHSGGDHRGEMP
ncbi:helix-turn-helix domain-containing protein [Amycolatopsis cynarae]|uniref:Helix-turn-helix domain-containing protein n=1 Tax=Amycolatopsis cynarae TaxID=2995223 RepID=A0ABY7B6Z2_9PSEU|nr:helix-turn-helix domain-containing protein [Amycolatopsis sp. HUAS 11-8]WAL67730.1 helix-turn-helix domain-containing protein [Amycolatopsis sp. HUAS 11-8]